jgi:anaerobic ribonucleoside-triphosphate reductase activating protein
MKIASTQYSLNTQSFEIYLSGCKGDDGVHCNGCHNPELWDFNIGEEYNTSYFSRLKTKIKEFDLLIKNIYILGGEPLDNTPNELSELLFELKTLDKDIWLFTHYEIDEIPEYVKNYCKYIKTGRYIPELKSDNNIQYGIKLASSNQKIYKLGGLNER